MDVYIAKDGHISGAYDPDEVVKRLEDSRFDGSELAWCDGLGEWMNVSEVLKGETHVDIEDGPSPPETEPEPLDKETLSNVNKIKELISDAHTDTSWQLIKSLNNSRIYEGLLEDCSFDDDGRVGVPNFLRKDLGLFLKLLIHVPQEAKLGSELKSVTGLNLKECSISDVGLLVESLKELTQLTSLSFYSTGTSDWSSLKELTQLTSLSSYYNDTSDWSSLKELTQLKKLALTSNTLSDDVNFLKDLTQLTELHLNAYNLSDVSALKDLTQLTSLFLNGRDISDVDPLKDLTQLTSLSLHYREISDLSSLKELTQLAELHLKCSLRTYEPIDVASLVELVKPLKELMQLKELYLHENAIDNVAPLKELTQLKLLCFRCPGSQYSTSGVLRLNKALPSCTIIALP